MNIGTGAPGIAMARFANGRAESTYALSDVISPVFDASANAAPPAHTKRMIVSTNSVTAAGAAPCTVYIRIPGDIGQTFVLTRTEVMYLATAAASPNALQLTRAFGPGAPFNTGTVGNGLAAVDGFTELMGGAGKYGVIPLISNSVNNSGLSGAALATVPLARITNAATQMTQLERIDGPFVCPSQRNIATGLAGETVLGWQTIGNATANDILFVNWYFDWYTRWFDPQP